MADGCTHKNLMVIWALIDVLWLSLIFDGYTTIIPIPLQWLKLNTMDPNPSFEHEPALNPLVWLIMNRSLPHSQTNPNILTSWFHVFPHMIGCRYPCLQARIGVRTRVSLKGNYGKVRIKTIASGLNMNPVAVQYLMLALKKRVVFPYHAKNLKRIHWAPWNGICSVRGFKDMHFTTSKKIQYHCWTHRDCIDVALPHHGSSWNILSCLYLYSCSYLRVCMYVCI